MKTKILDGATDLEDISELKLPWIKNQDQLNEVEAQNILIARRKHLRRRKNFIALCMNEKYFQTLHRDMFNEVWRWAGKWRQQATNIGVAPHQILVQLRELCEDIVYWDRMSSPLPIMERATILHHRLVAIHPFVNGNGRHARLITDIYLFNQGGELLSWPEPLQDTKNAFRKKYLQALRLADRGDYSELLDFLRKFSEKKPERFPGREVDP